MLPSASNLNRTLILAPMAGLMICLLAVGCGGKGAKPRTDKPKAEVETDVLPVVQTLPEGVWSGHLHFKGGSHRTSAQCLVLSSGESMIKTQEGFVALGKLEKGLGDFKAYALGENTFSKKAKSASCLLKVHAVQAKAHFSGTCRMDGATGTFTFDTYSPHPEKPLTLDLLAGVYHGGLKTNIAQKGNVVIILDSKGTLTGTDEDGGTLSGTFSIPDPTQSVIRIAAGTQGDPAGGTFTLDGFAHVSMPEGASPRTLDLLIAGSDVAFAGELKQQ